jgi:hypothetical protein
MERDDNSIAQPSAQDPEDSFDDANDRDDSDGD